MIRVSKGTPNENALRTMLVGAFLTVVILVGIDPAVRVYDEHLRVRPWLHATIEIIPQRNDRKPVLLYRVNAPAFVEGRWKAWPELESGRRLAGGGGSGTYSTKSVERAWDWDAFFEADRPVPNEPFRICVSYTVRTARGVAGDFGPFCSDLYDPRIPSK
ncbi:hypothetical protein [Oceaniglobus trochenteri]|uniref:hypothetical protein n=1 Tax=Oceaniglobus trochenteri TaxID=2763260 RepID=UPI001CFFBF3C|nr:hypothetical protein [Oceaniglobus trochenteri]